MPYKSFMYVHTVNFARSPVFTIFRYPFRFTFIFRTGLLCLLPGVQRLSIRIFSKEMMGQFSSVAYFFIGTVLFFAWIAVTMFKDIDSAGSTWL